MGFTTDNKVDNTVPATSISTTVNGSFTHSSSASVESVGMRSPTQFASNFDVLPLTPWSVCARLELATGERVEQRERIPIAVVL